MPPRDPNLPEGTDSIIDGTSNIGGSTGGSAFGGSTASDAFDAPLGSSGSAVGGSFGEQANSGFGGQSGASTTGSSMGGSSIGGSTTGGVGADVQSLKSQASDKVRDVASQGKDKAAEALDSVTRLVSETADTVDERLGPQYGDYVRRAAGALDGLNDSIRGKEVDELFDDARNLVRKSPAVAIGAAAAIGFLLVRLVKSGMPQTGPDDYDDTTGAGTQRLGAPPRVDNSYDPIA